MPPVVAPTAPAARTRRPVLPPRPLAALAVLAGVLAGLLGAVVLPSAGGAARTVPVASPSGGVVLPGATPRTRAAVARAAVARAAVTRAAVAQPGAAVSTSGVLEVAVLPALTAAAPRRSSVLPPRVPAPGLQGVRSAAPTGRSPPAVGAP